MWLLDSTTAQELRTKFRLVDSPTTAQLDQFAAHMREIDARVDAPRNLRVAGDVAEISINGVLTKKPDFFLWLFGFSNTTYEEIDSSLAMVSADDSIKRVVFSINSPGGNVDGLFDTLANLDAFTKPKSVRASLAASAAYAIASLGGKIEATNPAATFGSIGVVASFFLDEEMVEITSTEAPDKRPDPSTDEGKAVIREHLDAIHDLFADAIARGRGTTKDLVNANFGRGRVFVATQAKRLKMIDRIAKPALRAVRVEIEDGAIADSDVEPKTLAADAVKKKDKKNMTKEELKTQHPDLYAAVLEEGKAAGLAEGKTIGQADERKRVGAHLLLAEKTGAHKLARDAIASGASTLDEDVHAQYMAAAIDRRDVNARQDDSVAADAALSGVEGAVKPEQDLGDQVVALLDAQRGVKK